MHENHQEEHAWEDFLNGNDNSFDQFYQLLFPKLFNYGMYLTQDKDLVKDCIQALFIQFWTNRRKSVKIKSIHGYLFKSLRNRLYKQLNINHDTVFLNQDIISNYRRKVEQPIETTFIYQQSQEQVKKILGKAFTALTSRQKEAVYLRFYEDMSYEDIASLMTFKNPKYARTIIYRAIESLRKHLDKHLLA